FRGLGGRQSFCQGLRERGCSRAQLAVFRDKTKPQTLSEGEKMRVVGSHPMSRCGRENLRVRNATKLSVQECIGFPYEVLRQLQHDSFRHRVSDKNIREL